MGSGWIEPRSNKPVAFAGAGWQAGAMCQIRTCKTAGRAPVRCTDARAGRRLGVRRFWLLGLLLGCPWGCRAFAPPPGELFHTLPDGRRAWRTQYVLGPGIAVEATELDGRWLSLELGARPFPVLQAPPGGVPGGTSSLWKRSFSAEEGFVEQRLNTSSGLALLKRAELVGDPALGPTALRFTLTAKGSEAAVLDDGQAERWTLGWVCPLDPDGGWQLYVPSAWVGPLSAAPTLLLGTPLDFSASRSPLALLAADGGAGQRLRFHFDPAPAQSTALAADQAAAQVGAESTAAGVEGATEPPGEALFQSRGGDGTARLLARLSGHGRHLELWSSAPWLDVELLPGEPTTLLLEPAWTVDQPTPRSALWLLR
jgi:hypothetical protein